MITKETAKKIALGATVGFVVGATVTIIATDKLSFVLKEAKWTPQGDMLLYFYGRKHHMIIPKP